MIVRKARRALLTEEFYPDTHVIYLFDLTDYDLVEADCPKLGLRCSRPTEAEALLALHEAMANHYRRQVVRSGRLA